MSALAVAQDPKYRITIVGNVLLPDGTSAFTKTGASDINDNGDVILNGVTSNGARRSYIFRANGWTLPTDNPDNWPDPKIKKYTNLTFPTGFGIANVTGNALNNHQEVVLVGSGTATIALRWNGTSSSVIPRLYTGSGSLSVANDINDSGMVVGSMTNAAGTMIKAFRHPRNASTVTLLAEEVSTEPSSAKAINQGGYIVGYGGSTLPDLNPNQWAKLWTPTNTVSDMNISLSGLMSSQALYINNVGSIGESMFAYYNANAQLYHGCVNLNDDSLFDTPREPIHYGFSEEGLSLADLVLVGPYPLSVRRKSGGYFTPVNADSAQTLQYRPDSTLRCLGEYNKHGQFTYATKADANSPSILRVASPIWDDTRSVTLDLGLGDGMASNVDLNLKIEERYGNFTLATSNQTVRFTNGVGSTFVNTRLRGEVTMKVTVLDGTVVGTSNPVSPHWLSAKGTTSVPPSGGLQPIISVDLVNGDIDGTGNFMSFAGTNVINTDDYLIFNNAFDSSIGDSNWDHRADLNADGSVTTDDYIILSNNFDQEGEY